MLTVSAVAQPLEGNWEYVKMVSDGKVKEFQGSGLPWLELLKGQWSLMLSGRLSGGGPYQFSGDRLLMKYEDGSTYGDFRVQFAPPGMVLTGVGPSKGFDLHCRRVK
jgi:hypothetical protein